MEDNKNTTANIEIEMLPEIIDFLKEVAFLEEASYMSQKAKSLLKKLNHEEETP